MLEIIIDFAKIASPILAAIISGFFVYLVSRHKKLKAKLLKSYLDIQFYQEVEKVHVEIAIGGHGKDTKLMVRNIVRKELKKDHSGVTPSSIQRKIDGLTRSLH